MKITRITLSLPVQTKERLNRLVATATNGKELSNRSKLVTELINREARKKGLLQ